MTGPEQFMILSPIEMFFSLNLNYVVSNVENTVHHKVPVLKN